MAALGTADAMIEWRYFDLEAQLYGGVLAPQRGRIPVPQGGAARSPGEATETQFLHDRLCLRLQPRRGLADRSLGLARGLRDRAIAELDTVQPPGHVL